MLAKELDDISASTEQFVREHMEGHTNGATEPWLAQGIGFEKGDECPFCGLAIDGNDLVAAYRAYFGATYRALKEEVATLRNDVSEFGNDRTQLLTQQTLQLNAELTEFWKQFVSFEAPKLEFEEFLSAMSELRTHAVSAVDSKAAAILEPATLGADFGEASVRFKGSRRFGGGIQRGCNRREYAYFVKEGRDRCGRP